MRQLSIEPHRHPGGASSWRAPAVVAVLALVACHQTRKTLTPDVPTSGNADARARFQDERAKFLRVGGNGTAFPKIAEDFPDNPIVPWPSSTPASRTSRHASSGAPTRRCST